LKKAPSVSFDNKKSPFYQDLKKRVDQYFKENNLEKTGGNAILTKAIVLLAGYFSLFALLLIKPEVPIAILICVLMGIVHAGIGFGVMHDAAHGSFSSNRGLNTFFAYSANMLGGNLSLWKFKHNIIHHIEGADQDLAHMPVFSLNEHQEKRGFNRYQHVYGWFFYAVSLVIWVFALDFHKYFRMKVGAFPIERLTLSEHIVFWLSKVLFVLVYMVLPATIWGVGPMLIGLLIVMGVSGLILSTVFQMAHVVEQKEFPKVQDGIIKIEKEWAAHQLATTSNFCTGNAWLTWYTGGLNYQIEHHLFAKISHVHYPALRPIVMMTAKEYGIEYHEFESLGEALSSHYKHLKKVGVPDEALLEMG
jgi:linoleoyl-CoA desaturase